MWKRLSYPNIVPTLGAGPDIAELCVVSPWMPDGDLLQYHQKISGANRVEIARAHAGHAGEYTEYDIQDDWNHRGAFLPPLQRCHSRRHEGGEALRLGRFRSLTVVYQENVCSRGSHGSPTSAFLLSPSISLRTMLPPHTTATAYDGPHLKFWKHRMTNPGGPPRCGTFMLLGWSSSGYNAITTPVDLRPDLLP